MRGPRRAVRVDPGERGDAAQRSGTGGRRSGWPSRAAGRSGFSGLARRVVLIAFAMLLYFGIRNFTVGSVATAFANADRLVALERDLGVDREDALQSATVSATQS